MLSIFDFVELPPWKQRKWYELVDAIVLIVNNLYNSFQIKFVIPKKGKDFTLKKWFRSIQINVHSTWMCSWNVTERIIYQIISWTIIIHIICLIDKKNTKNFDTNQSDHYVYRLNLRQAKSIDMFWCVHWLTKRGEKEWNHSGNTVKIL